MKFKKKKTLLILATASLLTVGFISTSCSNGDDPVVTQKVKITWSVDTNATVAVEGFTSLPSEVDSGTKIVFTVTPKTGYELDEVKVNNKRVSPKNGKYTVTVSADTKIEVKTEEQIKELKITKKPTKLTYFAGESVDTTGMEVTVIYETGREATITQGASGYAISPSVFEGGETSFKVLFGDEDAVVDLTGTVEYLVTINPKGGTIADSWTSKIAAMDLNNYAVDSTTNVITFSYYNNLTENIVLPTKDEMSRTDFEFIGWGESSTTITNATKASVNAEAEWQAELVELESVELLIEENVPYLVIKGTFKAAEEVYLYLYEGNKQVEMKGDTYTGTRGEEFNVKFDLTKLKDGKTEDGGSFQGTWMDIRFNATLDDREESMEIRVGEGSTIVVDTEQKIAVDNYSYSFAVHENNLKVLYNMIAFTYNTTIQKETINGVEKDILTFKGTANPQWIGKYAEISWEVNSSHIGQAGCVIGNDGAFEIKADLANFTALKSMHYAHYAIYESIDNKDTPIAGGSTTNFSSNDSLTVFPELDENVGDISNAIRYDAANGLTYYVGHAWWDGMMMYVADESVEYTSVSLEMKDNKVYYVVSGTYSANKYQPEDLKFKFDYQHNSSDGQSDDKGWGTILTLEGETALTATVNEEDSTYKVSIDLSLLPEFNANKWVLTPHIGLASGNKEDLKPATISNKFYNLDGINYSLQMSNDTYNTAALVMRKTQVADSDPNKNCEMTGVDITIEGEKVYFIVNGTYDGYTKEEIEALPFNFAIQKNPLRINDGSNDWSTVLKEGIFVANDNSTFTFKADITSLDAYTYMLKFALNTDLATDLVISEAINKETTLGNKKYTLVSFPGSTESSQNWGCVGIDIVNL